MKALLLSCALVLGIPGTAWADHEYDGGYDRDYERDYEEDDRRRKDTCFMLCDNIIIVPELPGQGGGERER